jgi:hypothetical protein
MLNSLERAFPCVKIDQHFEDYYVFLVMKMQLGKASNLFTIGEPLCPSSKIYIL